MPLRGPHAVTRLALVFGAVFAAAVAAGAACTAWNDATVTQSADGGADVSFDTAPPPDALPESLPDTPTEGGDSAPPIPPGYLSMQDAARACNLSFTCPQIYVSTIYSVDVPLDTNNYSLCMQWAAGPIPANREGFTLQQTLLQCVASASSCLAAGACQVFENLNLNDPRCGGNTDGGQYCIDNGHTRLVCSTTPYAQHCDNGGYTPGTSCHPANDGNWCTVGGLDAGCPNTSACMSGTFQDYCGQDGYHFRLNCATFGDLCVPTDAGLLQCGAQQCGAVGVSCQGTSVAVCDAIEISPFDCANFGGTCASKGGAFYCAGPADTCTPLDSDINQCSGTSISVCVGGQKSMFDCASIGKTCKPAVAPQSAFCG